jgi:hypothetical protein
MRCIRVESATHPGADSDGDGDGRESARLGVAAPPGRPQTSTPALIPPSGSQREGGACPRQPPLILLHGKRRETIRYQPLSADGRYGLFPVLLSRGERVAALRPLNHRPVPAPPARASAAHHPPAVRPAPRRSASAGRPHGPAKESVWFFLSRYALSRLPWQLAAGHCRRTST